MAIRLPKGLSLPKGIKIPVPGRRKPQDGAAPTDAAGSSGSRVVKREPPKGGQGRSAAAGGRVVLIELDGPAFTATVAEIGRNGFRVLECHREEPCVGTEPHLTPTQWMFQRAHVDLPIHLLLPATVARLSESIVAKQKRGDLAAALARAARQGGGLCDEVFHGSRRLGAGVEPGSSRYSLLAVPSDSIVGELVQNPDLTLVSVMQCEQALLSALPDDLPEHALVVDGSPDRVRLILQQDGVCTETVELTSADHDALRTDLPRALTALAQEADGSPQAVVFSPSLGLGSDVSAFLAGGLTALPIDNAFTAGVPGWESGELEATFTTPGLASLGALQHLVRDAGLTTISFGQASRRRLSPRQLAGAGAAVMLLLSLTFLLGGDDAPAHKGKGKGKRSADSEPVAQAAERAPGADAAAPGSPADPTPDTPAPETSPVSPSPSPSEPPAASGRQALGQRMPASLALAEACNRVTDGIVLERVVAQRVDGLQISGSVDASTRLAGLQALAAYRAALLELPFVDGMVESLEYRDLESGVQELSFRLDLRWNESGR